MFSDILRCSQNILRCSQSILRYSPIFSDILRIFSEHYQNIIRYSQISSDNLRYSCKEMLNHVTLLQSIVKYCDILRTIAKCCLVSLVNPYRMGVAGNGSSAAECLHTTPTPFTIQKFNSTPSPHIARRQQVGMVGVVCNPNPPSFHRFNSTPSHIEPVL
jgi:hypothetical protein